MTWKGGKEKTPYYSSLPLPFRGGPPPPPPPPPPRQQRRATNFNLRARHGAAGACAICSQIDRRTAHSLYLLSSKPRRGEDLHYTQSVKHGEDGGEGGRTTIEYSHIYESPPRVMPLPLSLSLSLKRRRLGRPKRPTDRDRRLPLSSFLSSPILISRFICIPFAFAEHTHTHTHTACPVLPFKMGPIPHLSLKS